MQHSLRMEVLKSHGDLEEPIEHQLFIECFFLLLLSLNVELHVSLFTVLHDNKEHFLVNERIDVLDNVGVLGL